MSKIPPNKVKYFIIQLLPTNNVFKIHTFEGHKDDETKSSCFVDFWLNCTPDWPILTTINKFALTPDFKLIRKSQFKKPSNKDNKWIFTSCISYDISMNTNTSGILILQYSKKYDRLCGIPLDDIHKIPDELLTCWTFSSDINDGRKYGSREISIEYNIYKVTKNMSMFRNVWLKNITLFEMMADEIDLEETNYNKKRRF